MRKESGYVAGWDGGGTKTECEIRFFSKKTPVSFFSGALNVVKEKESEKTIEEILSFMKELEGGLSACEMLCIGVAGVSNPNIVDRIRKALKEYGYEGRLQIVGDDVTAFKGALGGKEGIALISGTGSICIGFDKEGRKYRAGGYGYLIDDEGSGYSIGRDILSAVIREYDGRGEKTVLTDLVFERLGIESIEELITWVYSPENGKKEIASLSILLTQGIEKADCVSQRICQKAILELYGLVEAIRKRMGVEKTDLALCGSMVTKCIPVQEGIKKYIKKENSGIHIIYPRYGAATGACIRAIEQLEKEKSQRENTERV